MKRYPHSAIILLAVLALVGCSKAEEFQTNSDSALQIESVSGISPFALMQEPATKAVITGNTLTGSDAATGVGIFVTASNGGAYDGHDSGYTNVKYAYSSTKWSAASPIYLSNTIGNLYGYFPYNSEANDLRAIPVQSSLNGTDYLYAEPQTVSHSNKTVSLQMNHALSRLQLTIKKGENFTADASLSKITLKSTAIDATGTMDLTTGVITASKKSGETGIVELATDGEITAQGIEKDILIVPADNTEGKKDIAIFLTIDNKATGASLSGESGLDIRSGIQNNVTLTIEDTGIKVTGVDVGVWSESGSQMVDAQGHTVTVKLSNDAADAGISDDLIVQVASNGSSVIVKTYSDSGKPLIIREEDGKPLAPVEEGNKSTFSISNIASDVTATLAYAKTRTVTFNMKVDKAPNVSGYVYGKAEPITVIEGRPSILTATTGEGYAVDYFNVKGTKYGDKAEVFIPDDVETIDAYFRYIDILDGVFTVYASLLGDVIRKVRFSKGNLWYGKLNGESTSTFHIESEQFNTTPSSSTSRNDNHISHFMWCKSANESVKMKYEVKEWNISKEDILFTNATDFAVSGQKGFWRTLTGGDDGEWKYLIDRKGGTLYKFGVTVCGRTNCLILLPDDWEWDANTVGTGWQTEYSESTDVKWSTMEAAGAVCLPAAGARNGEAGRSSVENVGDGGYYWSHSFANNATIEQVRFMNFESTKVSAVTACPRSMAYSIRLVTDVQ